MKTNYIVTKRIASQISQLTFSDEKELLIHLEAMWRNTKWQLISIVAITAK